MAHLDTTAKQTRDTHGGVHDVVAYPIHERVNPEPLRLPYERSTHQCPLTREALVQSGRPSPRCIKQLVNSLEDFRYPILTHIFAHIFTAIFNFNLRHQPRYILTDIMLFNIASIALLAIGAGAAAVEQPAEVSKTRSHHLQASNTDHTQHTSRLTSVPASRATTSS